MSACTARNQSIDKDSGFCRHCVTALCDPSRMSPAERHAYFIALLRWYSLHHFSLSDSLAKQEPADPRRCGRCGVGSLDSDNVCHTCGHIQVAPEQLRAVPLRVLEKAVQTTKRKARDDSRTLPDFGIRDYTNPEQFYRGLDDKARQLKDILNQMKEHALKQLHEHEEQEKHLVDMVSEETFENLRRSPDVNLTSLPAERRQEIEGWIRTEYAPAMISGTRDAFQRAQSRLEKVMYYGQEMILQNSPMWSSLTARQQKAMLARHADLEKWWGRPNTISFLLYCLAAPFLGVPGGILLWLTSLGTLTAVAVSWYVERLNVTLGRLSIAMVVLGLAALSLTVNRLGSNWPWGFGVLLAIALLSPLVSPLLRAVLWDVRSKVIK